MNNLFYICVDFLHWLEKKLHLSYEEINIWIFIIIEPIIFLIMLIWIIRLRKKLKKRKD